MLQYSLYRVLGGEADLDRVAELWVEMIDLHHDLDERFWVPNGVLNCGKGDPMQISAMTHGASTARFRNIKVGAATKNMAPSGGVV